MKKRTVDVVLTNRTATFPTLADEDIYSGLRKAWSFSVPGFRYVQNARGDWDGRIQLYKYGKCPAGLFRATRKEVEEELGVRFRVFYKRKELEWKKEKFWKTTHDESEYRFQNECVEAMVKATRRGGGLILNATGTGKTRIAGQYFSRMKGQGLMVVDQLDLMHQAKRDIEEVLGREVGWVGKSEFEPRRITVGTVQSLHKHRKRADFRTWYRDTQAMIIDEIHVQINRRNFGVVTAVDPVAVFGLTATLQMRRAPVRLRAWSLAGPVLFEYPITKGMDEGVLSKGVVVRVLFQNEVD